MTVLPELLSASAARALSIERMARVELPPPFSEALLASLVYFWNDDIRRATQLGGLPEARIETPFGRNDSTAWQEVSGHFQGLGYKTAFDTSYCRHGREYDRFAVVVSW